MMYDIIGLLLGIIFGMVVWASGYHTGYRKGKKAFWDKVKAAVKTDVSYRKTLTELEK